MGNSARRDNTALRRARVAELRLKQFSQERITKVLAQEGIVNPNDGEPWSQATVSRDLEWAREQWKRTALDEFIAHKGQVLAELDLIKKEAWQNPSAPPGKKGPRLFYVLRAIEAQMKVLGLEGDDVAQTSSAAISNFQAGIEAASKVYLELEEQGAIED